MSDPIVMYDFEWGFQSGDKQFITAIEGRDRIARDDVRMRVEAHTSEHVTEEIIVHLGTLEYERTTKRTLVDEAQADALVKLVEGNG